MATFPKKTDRFHHMVFRSYRTVDPALREAAAWIEEHTATVSAEPEEWPVLIVKDISCHEYESCWTVHVYCEEFSG